MPLRVEVEGLQAVEERAWGHLQRVGHRFYTPQTGEFLSVDPDVATTHEPYEYADDDPLNMVDPTGWEWFWVHTTWHTYKGTKYGYECGRSNGKGGDLTTATHCGSHWCTNDGLCTQGEAKEFDEYLAAHATQAPSSPSPPAPSSIAQGLQAASNALGTAAVGADVANVAEAGAGLLPAEAVSIPATVTLNGLSTATGCAANVLGDGGMDNCYAGIAIFVGTSGFGSSSAVHAVSAAIGDTMTIYNDINSYVPW